MNDLQPFQNDDTRVLDSAIHKADQDAANLAAWLNKPAQADADRDNFLSMFLSTQSTGDAKALVDQTRLVQDLRIVASAIENAGGPSEARLRRLNNRQNFDTLARGLAARSAAIAALVKPLRAQLGERRKVLTEEGVVFQLIEADGEVRRLGLAVAAIENSIREADEASSWCRRWDHSTTERTFDELYAILTRPLPTV